MQTAVDIAEPRPQRRWPRWAAVGGVLVVVAGSLLVMRGLTAQEQPPLTAVLAGDVVTVLETATPEDHADHGHHFEDYQVLCEAEVFGFDPPGATSVAEVEQVYALHKCAITSGLEWPMSVRAYGPLVLDLTGPDPRIVLPGEMDLGDEAVHADRIRALIPQQYHQAALAPDFTDPSLTDDLRQRLDAAS